MSQDLSLENSLARHREGDIAGAIASYHALLLANPRHADTLHYLGLAYLQSGNLPQAETFLLQALSLDPRSANTVCDCATLRLQQKRYQEALALFAKALDLNPNHADSLNNLGETLIEMGRPRMALPCFERLALIRTTSAQPLRRVAEMHYKLGNIDAAIQHFQRAIALDPDDRVTRISLGDAYESAGKFKQARMQYMAVLSRSVDSPIALARLLQLREGSVEVALLAKARQLADSESLPADARIRLSVGLAHFFDRHGEYDDAFRYLKLGNDQRRALQPYDSDGFSRAVDALIQVFSPALFQAHASSAESHSERPLFIVGMPRSGTTLTEQILASHPAVAPGGELSTILGIVRQVGKLAETGRPYPHGVPALSANQMAKLRGIYLSRLDQVSANAARVTDKLPFNFMHLGLIALLFPASRVIHCSRHPLDTSLSCYFTSFAQEIGFASDLRSLGRYYLDYQRLMAHWRAVLPIPILEVRYEDMVADLRHVVQDILDHCGLGWQDACMAFHTTDRGVRTPSRWQVRQRIYASSIGRWKNYEKHLQPLRELLAPILTGRADSINGLT